jgi:hypothetical protein
VIKFHIHFWLFRKSFYIYEGERGKESKGSQYRQDYSLQHIWMSHNRQHPSSGPYHLLMTCYKNILAQKCPKTTSRFPFFNRSWVLTTGSIFPTLFPSCYTCSQKLQWGASLIEQRSGPFTWLSQPSEAVPTFSSSYICTCSATSTQCLRSSHSLLNTNCSGLWSSASLVSR